MYKFRAKTHIGITVNVKGGHVHITFTELTGGGSIYTTESKEIAEALRKHHKFGKLFTEEEVKEETAKQQELEQKKADDRAKQSIKEFACVEDAKEYMADTFGISRSKLRTRGDIEKQAAGRGITIQWADKKAEIPVADDAAPQQEEAPGEQEEQAPESAE